VSRWKFAKDEREEKNDENPKSGRKEKGKEKNIGSRFHIV
jgi:hypothetical protein